MLFIIISFLAPVYFGVFCLFKPHWYHQKCNPKRYRLAGILFILMGLAGIQEKSFIHTTNAPYFAAFVIIGGVVLLVWGLFKKH
jgi:hypothetical protein